jgi:cytochrome o ubiquinol oxidase subunit 1
MFWTLAFIVTFAIGGMAGVLLSVPPADYVLHNSLFLIAHFHNMLIPGTLFGFFAGYAYWFPKAIGFTLNEKWGKRAFWCWLSGFYMAFFPLYILGVMGMPRRMQHYDNPAWHPYLIIAAAGTALISLGILFQMIQLFVSIRERHANRDLTGDPWDGRTLEWATASPPAPYNFAVIPVVRDIDAFWDMKERGVAYQKPAQYHDISIPKNSVKGFLVGAFTFIFGFSMVWYIWYMAVLSGLAIILTVILRACDDETEYTLSASRVAEMENARFRQLSSAFAHETAAVENSLNPLSGK